MEEKLNQLEELVNIFFFIKLKKNFGVAGCPTFKWYLSKTTFKIFKIKNTNF